MSRPVAMSGRMPIMTNSVMPIPKPPSARGARLFLIIVFFVEY